MDDLTLVFVQCLIVGAALVALLFYKQTAFLGITCLFAFNVISASLSGFFFGRLFGLREQWITVHHEEVLVYSGWMAISMVGAMWLAWLPKRRQKETKQEIADSTFPWVTPGFIYFTLTLGTIATVAIPFVLFSVATVGTAVNLLASWLKIGLIASVVLFKVRGNAKPMLIALALFAPAAAINALRSGFSPFSVDVIVCVALIATCLNRVTVFSFIKVIVVLIPFLYLMFAWLASRNLIRSGQLEQFSLGEKATRFADAFVDELHNVEFTPYDIQELLFERIDMTDLLAQEAGFEESAPGDDQYRYGGTYLDGAFALVPRVLWPEKPLVAGYADFVGEYTGTTRDDSTSIGVPEQFELYANGGPPFVVVGMFLLTYLCARLERFIASYRGSLHVLMPSLMFLMAFHNGVEQIMLVLASAVAGAASSFVIAKMIEVFFPKFLPEFRTAKKRRRSLDLRAPATA